MQYQEKQIFLSDKTSCILKSPNEHDAEQMLSYFTAVSGESYFMINYLEEIIGNVSVYSLSDRMKMRHRACLGIAIRKEYQSKGLGKILLAEGILTAKNAGYTQIELGVFSDNEKALRLYEKSGFEKWGRTKNAFRLKDGTYRDEIIMGQLL